MVFRAPLTSSCSGDRGLACIVAGSARRACFCLVVVERSRREVESIQYEREKNSDLQE
jgi:hypothetical protein